MNKRNLSIIYFNDLEIKNPDVPRNIRIKILSAGNSLFKLAKKLRQGKNKYAAGKISKAVESIEGEACCYPGEHTLEAQSEEERLGGGIKYAVAKSVKGAYRHVNGHCHLLGHILGEQHGHAPKNCPDIKVGDPPCCKAVVYTRRIT